MAARVCRLHHVSLHVSDAARVARALVSRFRFSAVGASAAAGSRQVALRKGGAVFVVNERRTAHEPGSCLYDVHAPYPVDSACNVCFEVEDVEDACARLRERGCEVLVPPTEARDPHGSVLFSVVRSVLGNVRHTLLDRSRYRGAFLPGFRAVQERDPDPRCPVTHFDHVTYACPRSSTAEVMRWYQENFGFQRFLISR